LAEPTTPASGLIHFGVFQVNLRTGELRKNGSKMKLEGQPFQILALLLERPGDLVTREELEQKLWAPGTFVDFEHSINAAVSASARSLATQQIVPISLRRYPAAATASSTR
jgi:cholera toxin transcriptional activator